jgi:hypothetical protein
MNINLTYNPQPATRNLQLKITGSKSETNRLLLLKALYPNIKLENTLIQQIKAELLLESFTNIENVKLNLDLEEFIDLKSVSNYGWRVDIERLRSKYFVDQMRHKDDDDAP